MHRTLIIIALFTGAAMPGLAQTATRLPEQNTNVEQVVLGVIQEWLAADERHDRTALNRIIADDFLGTGPVGTTVSKRDIIPQEGTDAEARGLSMNAQDIKVRVFGDTALVTGRGLPKTQIRERAELRFTVVLVKRAGNWQMVGAHLSSVPRE